LTFIADEGCPMRPYTSLLALALAVVSAMTFASAVCSAQQSPQGAANTIEERQRSCNEQASAQNLVGDPRKAFMSDCLSGEPKDRSGTSTANTQEKLEQACNTTASSRQLTGDTRKSFMAECLKGELKTPR
jgi:psiF repeat